MCRYRFSPSTLDKFQKVLDAEKEFESDFNYNEETGYKLSLEEIRELREQELLDSINKVPQEPSEAASRGTAFNELVDAIIRAINAGDDSIKSIRDDVIFVDVNYETSTIECEGFTFVFDSHLAEQVASMLWEGTMQLHVQAKIETSLGDVLLHGYPDYILPTQVTDLKTTGNYKGIGHYSGYWQRYVYPYILQRSCLLQRCDLFEFLVVEMKKNKKTNIISGEVYTEVYTDMSLERCKEKLTWICEALITWLDAHASQITNRKIFCEQ